MTGRGSELHFNEGTSDKFYRIIWFGLNVFVRFGRRGSEGQVKIKHFCSIGDAGGYWEDQHEAKRRKGYAEIYRSSFEVEGTMSNAAMEDPYIAECAFVDEWVHLLDSAFKEGTGDLTWVVVRGLESRAKTDPFHAALLGHLVARPHGSDSFRDRMLAQVPNEPALREAYRKVRGAVFTECISAVKGDETQGEINKVLTLYSDDHPGVAKLFSTVRRAGAASALA